MTRDCHDRLAQLDGIYKGINYACKRMDYGIMAMVRQKVKSDILKQLTRESKMDTKKLLITARCRKFAKFCKANPSFCYHIPDEIVDICKTDEDVAEARELLKNLGLQQHPVSGAWEAA